VLGLSGFFRPAHKVAGDVKDAARDEAKDTTDN
jgi:hypothetical protein